MRAVAVFIATFLLASANFVPIIGCDNSLYEHTGSAIESQDEERYLSLSATSLIVKPTASPVLTISITNRDSQRHDFIATISTAADYLDFYVAGEKVDALVTNDSIRSYRIPIEFTDIVNNRTVSFGVAVHASLPLGVVYALGSFTVHLSRDGMEMEEKNVKVFITEGYSTIHDYRMNNTGAIAPNVQYCVSSNPLLASTESVLTVRINNTDSFPHYYTLTVHDRVGYLRMFEGDTELQKISAHTGFKFIIPIGTVYSYDSIPFRISVSQIPGALWSRHMMDVSIRVDNTTHNPAHIGLDVGNDPPTEVEIGDMKLEKISDSEIRVTIKFQNQDTDDENGMFGMLFHNYDVILLFQWVMPGVISTIITKAVFPHFFPSLPLTGLSFAIIGFCLKTGIGLIFHGLMLYETNPIQAWMYIILGVAVVAIVIIVVIIMYAKQEGYYEDGIAY